MSHVFKALAQKLSASSEVNTEKTGLLLQYFESSPFYAWTAWQYLNENFQPAVQDYLFLRLHELGEDAIEKFLLQFVYLAVHKPGQVPESTVIKLCSKSFGIAIKAHWLFTALGQDHPKNKTLERLRERTRKAAVEWNRDAPLRNGRNGFLSPNRSRPLSPPFSPPFSPGSSLILSHFPSPPGGARDLAAVTPPDHIVMSPPNNSLVTACTSPTNGIGSVGAAAFMAGKQRGALEVDVPCLLPAEAYGPQGPGATVVAGGVTPLAANAKAGAAVNGPVSGAVSNTAWTPSCRQIEAPAPAEAAAASWKAGALAHAGSGVVSGGKQGCRAGDQAPGGKKGPGSGGGSVGGGRDVGGSDKEGQVVLVLSEPNRDSDRAKALRAELGEGETVSLLIARSQQQGAAVSAIEEELPMNDDDRPTSPLTELRYQKFDATLDVVDALCEASISVASVSQAERVNALRWSLEQINSGIEALNKDGVDIWFPMSRVRDRVLRLTAKEAVVLTSREKAPYLLYIEVLEDQPEGTEQGVSGEGQGSGAAAEGAGKTGSTGGAWANGGAAAVGDPPAPLAVEFGRRETYGIALTEIGAQHQQHFMRSSPGRPSPPVGTAAAGTSPVRSPLRDQSGPARNSASGVPAAATHPQPDPRASCTQVPSLPSSPSPIKARSPSFAAALEEDALNRAAAIAAASAVKVIGWTGDGGSHGVSAATTSGASASLQAVTPLAAAAPYLTIPTRSSSSSNIAAIALAAMAASASNASQDADAWQRSSEGGAHGAGTGTSGRLPLTPRMASGNLPPRPPMLPEGGISPIHAAKEAKECQVRRGNLSPTRRLRRSLGQDEGAVLAAAVLSEAYAGPLLPSAGSTSALSVSGLGSGAGGGGDRSHPGSQGEGEEQSSQVGKGDTSGRGREGVARALWTDPAAQPGSALPGRQATEDPVLAPALSSEADGQTKHGSRLAGPGERQSQGTATGNVTPVSVTGLLNPVAIETGAEGQALPPPADFLSYCPQGAGPAGQGTGPVTGVTSGDGGHATANEGPAGGLRPTPPPPRLEGVELAEAQEKLLAAGLLSPTSRVARDPALERKLDDLLAALQGAAPLVRVHIIPLSQPLQMSGGAAGSSDGVPPRPPPGPWVPGTAAQRHGSPLDHAGSGCISGSDAAPLSRAAMPDPAAAARSKSVSVPALSEVSAPGVAAPSEKKQGLKIFSRFSGLCRQPATDDDLPVPSSATAPAGTATTVGWLAGGGVGAPSDASSRGRQGGLGAPEPAPKLVRVIFDTGINLAIPSPHVHHRRTPSEQAMEKLQGQLKIRQLPPPYQSGPPVVPTSYGIDVSNHSVQEWSSEEGDAESGSDRPPYKPGKAAPAAATQKPIDLGQLRNEPQPVLTLPPHSSATSPAGATTGTENVTSSSDERSGASKGKARNAASEGGATAMGGGGGGLFQSSWKIMSRSNGPQAQSDGSFPAPSGGSPPLGPSPRGVSPVRGSGAPGPIAASAIPPGKKRLLGFGGGGSSGGGATSAAAAAAAEAAGSAAGAAAGPGLLPGVHITDGRKEREAAEARRRERANAVYGDPWAATVQRIKSESPYGNRKGWSLRRVIVKCGDDCRQELLALQLVRTFGEIFREANLPLWVRYYEVLVTSNKTALIEMVPDTLSIHSIKARSPPGTSLSDHFFAKFGRPGTPGCIDAQRRFTESLAAYSLICYLLQIKDRHNGNILMDRDGRIIHIDFGFLLSNSPGGVNFESAPFKLTREMLEVMESNSDGKPSEMFDYFKVLMIQGFLAVRKNSDRILLILKMMFKSGFPCFKGGERAIRNVEKRLQLSLTEVQCVPHVLHLIAESLDAWRTRQYDYYQRLLNGIL